MDIISEIIIKFGERSISMSGVSFVIFLVLFIFISLFLILCYSYFVSEEHKKHKTIKAFEKLKSTKADPLYFIKSNIFLYNEAILLRDSFMKNRLCNPTYYLDNKIAFYYKSPEYGRKIIRIWSINLPGYFSKKNKKITIPDIYNYMKQSKKVNSKSFNWVQEVFNATQSEIFIYRRGDWLDHPFIKQFVQEAEEKRKNREIENRHNLSEATRKIT